MIRPATNADEAAITALVFEVLREYGLEPDPEATDADLKDIEGSYAERGGCLDVLLDDEGRIVGSVGLYPLVGGRCELRKMYLHRRERGKGVGRLLLEHALTRAVDLGFTEVVLETASALIEATRLYRDHGFVPYDAPHLSARCDQAYIKRLPREVTSVEPSPRRTLEIREVLNSDAASIRHLIGEAFGSGEEIEIADLVAALMADPTARPLVSLVAVKEGEVVGHILFSRVRVDGVGREARATILAPLCVGPGHQNEGIGGALVRAGLEACQRSGCCLVFVLGHPGYYPRHGFVPAGPHGLKAPYPIEPRSADAWMVQELRPKALVSCEGTVICADSLMDPKYWRE